MEHKLITGGEHWLPFARSRLKALRATGLHSASQQFVMSDGVEVKVRCVGEQDYIRISGGALPISMDAGLIDLKGVTPGHPLRYTSGTRQDTASTQSYNAPFTVAATGGKWAAWRSNPAQVPRHQIAGTVVVPQFAGHLKAGALAPSFSAKRKAVDPATEPPTWTDDPEDAALLAKKRMAKTCPASMFTGRMRLYVQAMYGRPLYEYGSDAGVEPSTPGVQGPSLAPGAMPALTLPAYKHKGDDTVYPPLTVDTSTGVFYSASKHWLVQITAGALNVYPLLSSDRGEALRKYLNAAKLPDKQPMDPADKDKLEAFILAYCLPDIKNVVSVDCPGAGAAYSMGYGWHWNWSGTAADVVTSTTFDQGGGKAAMESTHRRVSVTLNAGQFSASHQVIDNKKRWAVNRVFWCIAEPQWGEVLSTLKSTPKNSTLFDCEATFYAFYVRDDLRLCRIKVEAVAATPDTRTLSVGFASTTYGVVPSEFTAGMLDGYCDDAAATGPHHKATISIGTTVVSGLVIGKTTNYTRWDVYGKREVVPPTRFGANDLFLAAGNFAEMVYGYDVPYGAGYQTDIVWGPGYTNVTPAPTVEFTRSTNNGVRSESSTLTAVVPFHDAEAIFCDTAAFTTDSKTDRQIDVKQSQAFVYARLWIPDGGAEQVYRKFLVGGTAGSLVSSSTPPALVTETVVHSQKLHCRAAAPVDATMGELGSFHDAEDYAQVTYSVLSGASAPALGDPLPEPPVVISPSNAVPQVGVVGDLPLFPALVGWI